MNVICGMEISDVNEKAMIEGLCTNQNDKGFVDEPFYSPLSMTGYLTPLQRKKLREKRNLSSVISDTLETNDSKKVKKPRVIKRKKENYGFASGKSKIGVKRAKPRDCISQIQCSAAKVVSKTDDLVVKNKKFFKASSPNRLERASFSLPFVFKKSLFSSIDKCAKESLSVPKKRAVLEEIPSNDLSSPSFDVADSPDKGNNFRPYLIRLADESLKKMSVFDFEFDWPSDELLLERQVKARAEAAMKRKFELKSDDAKLKEVETNQNTAEPPKLFPIFYAASKKQSKSPLNTRSKPVDDAKQKNSLKKVKGSLTSAEQMIIDAGQKEIGAKICSVCNMIYSIGLEEDEKLHLNYHNMYLINLKFPGWKEENVIGEYGDGRVIMIKKNDPILRVKKVEDVLQIANRDLGFSSSSLPAKPDLVFILFISNKKQVAGLVIAEPISCAYRVMVDQESASIEVSEGPQESIKKIGNLCLTSETVPAICGINRVWVAHNYRRRKVASRMIDCLRCHFIYGHVIGIRELAFTDPSLSGRQFAMSYTGTPSFLVYR